MTGSAARPAAGVSAGAVPATRSRAGSHDWLALGALVLDAVALALVEVFFLPLRFDGLLLPDLGSWPFPITALLAVVTMPWLVTRAGEVSARLLVAGAPLFAWLVTVGVVGLVGVENMVLLADWRTLLLLAAATLPAAIALGNTMARGARRPAQGRGTQ